MTRSRIEADREDLLAEAANLVERVEFKIPGIDTPVTIGRNRQGHWSFYFGPEPMSRFDADGGLRRAVRDGKLYRTQGETLAELTRVRLDHETQLQRRDLNESEVAVLLEEIRNELLTLKAAFENETATLLRQAGTTPQFVSELAAFLRTLTAAPLKLADALPTKRK